MIISHKSEESTNNKGDDIDAQTKPVLNEENANKEQETPTGSSDDKLVQEASTDQKDVEQPVASESNDNHTSSSPDKDDTKATDIDQNQPPESPQGDSDQGQEQPPTNPVGNDGNIDETPKTDISDTNVNHDEIETNLHPEESGMVRSPTFPDDMDDDVVHRSLIKSPSKMSIHGGITIAWDNIVAKVRSKRPNLIRRLTSSSASEIKYKTILHGSKT